MKLISDFLVNILGENLNKIVTVCTVLTAFISLILSRGEIFHKSYKWYRRVRWGGWIIIGFSLIGAYFNDLQGTYNDQKIDRRNNKIESSVSNNYKIAKNTDNSVNYLKGTIEEQAKTIKILQKNNETLISQNRIVISSNKDVAGSNKSLIDQNQHMLERIDKYQYDIEQRNKLIEELRKETTNIKLYAYYSRFTIMGTEYLYGDGIDFTSDLSSRMKKFLVKDGNTYNVKMDLSLLSEVNSLIKDYPQFPFGYYVKYTIELNNSLSDWKNTAHKAEEILEITTSIAGHNQSQDQALKNVRNHLRIFGK